MGEMMKELKRWIAVLFKKCVHPTFKIVAKGEGWNDMLQCNYCKTYGRSSGKKKEFKITWDDGHVNS